MDNLKVFKDSKTMGMFIACKEFSNLNPNLDLICCVICEAYARYQVIGAEISDFDRMCLTLRYEEFATYTGSDTDIDSAINEDTAISVQTSLRGIFCDILGYSPDVISSRLSNYGLK